MYKAYKYRIYPNDRQRVLIEQTFGACRAVYNAGLELTIWLYNSYRINVSAIDLGYELPEIRKQFPWIGEVDSQTLSASLRNMGRAYENFFNGAGYPKFKSKRGPQSFQCRNNKREVDWSNNTLTIPKIKNIPIRLSRKFEGEIKTVTISRTPTKKYFASVLVKLPCSNTPPPPPQKYIGIDLGINDFATISTGEKIANQRCLRNELKRLTVLQRRASRKKKGSKNRKKAALKVADLHEKITNQRQDFLHKLSTRLISDNQTDTICVEDLAVKNMVKNHKSMPISPDSIMPFDKKILL
jgi:putative transposase